jgi:peptide/nickel transport system permease protein
VSSYILRRLALAVPTLLLTTVLVFGLMHTVPGNALIARIAASGTVSPEQLATFKHENGLDKPLPVQYLTWLRGVASGHPGHSIYTGELITHSLERTVPITLQLAVLAILASTIVGIVLGVLSAILRNSPWDFLIRLVSIVGLSAPSFWIGTMAVIFLARWLHWQPPLGHRIFFTDPIGTLEQMWLPAVILGYALAAVTARMTRSTALEVMHDDFVRTARAKGLKGNVVWTRHVLRNAMLPVLTVIGGQIIGVLGGTVIIETIFALPGLGRLLIDSINFRDYPLVETIVLIFAVLVQLINLLTDLGYAWLDPRIRYT